MSLERRLTVFSGRVQGVGFRMRCVAISRRFQVAGYVRNLPDGTVEVATSGETGEIDRFLAEISAAMNLYIASVVPHYWDSVEIVQGFGIRG